MAALAAVWVLLGTGMWLAGVSGSTLHTVLTLVLDPLWFLGVYAGLTALTPVAVTLVRRLGAAAALIPLAVVAAVDAVRLGLGGPSWVGWINVVAGWLVPYLLGIAWARGAFASRKLPALMLAGGVAATIALIVWAGYPASMVGVNGARISNLNPPIAWPWSRSASPRSASRCCCGARWPGSCASPSRGRRWRWPTCPP